MADAGRTIVQAARDHGISWPVVADAFTAHASRVFKAAIRQVLPYALLVVDHFHIGQLVSRAGNSLNNCRIGGWRVEVGRWPW